jgi:hypothetical protein
MKWIKNRKQYLNEAKIKDLVLPRQRKEISKVWGEKWLDYEEIDPTDKIKQGQWKLSEEDKNKVLGAFFGWQGDEINMEKLFSIFKELPEHFSKILLMSIDLELLDEKYKIIMNNFNPNKPSVDQITAFFEPVFRKLSINDTKADNFIKKDKDGRPIKDSEGNMLRAQKEKGEPIFDKNLVNINTFIDSYNKSYKEIIDDFKEMESDIFYHGDISRVVNLSKENHNQEYKFDFEIFDKDMFLKIIHNPKDILNMSISKFYASCQHLYSGGYREYVLPNVFDPNSIPAFLYFDSDIYWGDEKISDFLPISRMIIRNIDNEDDDLKIYFDRTYPDRVQNTMEEMVEKYSGNKMTIDYVDDETYLFTPDIDFDDELKQGYHDRFERTKTLKMIGKNTKKLILNRNHDWSKIKISPNNKLEEIIIETSDLPENLLTLDLNPKWIKFRYMELKSLKQFDKMITDSIAFDKCKFEDNVLIDLNENNPNLKKLQIVSCDYSSNIDLSIFKNLKELHLVYTINSLEELIEMTNKLENLDKLVVSGDLLSEKEAKEYINDLKRKGIKVETVGPVI